MTTGSVQKLQNRLHLFTGQLALEVMALEAT